MNKLKALIRKPLNYIVRCTAAAVRDDATELNERILVTQGKQLSNWAYNLKNIAQLENAEFRIFSQFGDDGIIQYVIGHLKDIPKTFIEFGVESYTESNTRFLLMNNNWSGFIMDGSDHHIDSVKSSYYYWRYELQAKAAFITTENINDLLRKRPFANVGILHIDLDGNDFWIWKAINCIEPSVVIVEYNSIFGQDRSISVPYAQDFGRTQAHYSNLYFGASLSALTSLALEKGYVLIGSNSAGNNAYFIRHDLVNDHLRQVSVEDAYRKSTFRESRSETGKLTFLSGNDRLQVIKGLPVVNVKTNSVEQL
jgi:hypothetical protein